MVNVILDPLSDHVGYHLLHWVVSQSGAWYSKVNENLQDNLRSIETGVAVIDDILTPKEEEIPFENQQHIEPEHYRYRRNSDDHHINILNQIINMNINNSNNNDRRGSHVVRRNAASGQFNFSDMNLIVFARTLHKWMSHVGLLRAFHSDESEFNSPWIRPVLIFLFIAQKMDNFKFFFK